MHLVVESRGAPAKTERRDGRADSGQRSTFSEGLGNSQQTRGVSDMQAVAGTPLQFQDTNVDLWATPYNFKYLWAWSILCQTNGVARSTMALI